MNGRKTCGAKVRSTGKPCRAPAMQNGRCRVHGGASRPPGPLHHSYKNGRYSKALDGQAIAQLYDIARNDPRLLALREDIAVLSALQQQTLTGLSTGESGTAWQTLADVLGRLGDALAAGAPATAADVLCEAQAIVTGALGDAHVWAEYTERAESIRKLVDTERKYEEGLRLHLPLETAQAVMAIWMDAIRRTVPQQYIAKLYEEVRKVRTDAGSPIH